MKKTVLLFSFLFSLGLAAEEAGTYSDGIAAKVNGKAITVFDVKNMVQREEREIRSRAAPAEVNQKVMEARQQSLERLIDNQVILTAFRNSKYEVPSTLIETEIEQIIARDSGGDRDKFLRHLERGGLSMEEFRDKIEEKLAIRLMMNENVRRKVVVTPQDVSLFYNRNPELYSRPAQVQIRLLMVRSRAEAEAALGEIAAGKSFAEIADRVSLLPKAEKDGGDMGMKARNEIRADFQAVIAKLKPGQRSGVIETPNGSFLIELVAEKAGGLIPLEELKDRIREDLEDEQSDRLYKEWISGLRKGASIELMQGLSSVIPQEPKK
ncbi:MAG: peptidyl-prolyl cis-trans isomerase C/peptidyl-prolyl cis-trans isomerase SurA [Verrucomicrobiota bacterium]|jgi:parvulin-like peptidyl-prolyl isomerase